MPRYPLKSQFYGRVKHSELARLVSEYPVSSTGQAFEKSKPKTEGLFFKGLFMKKWWGYFGRPFPCTRGFSPYRFPGMIVHLPIMAATTALGILLCAEHPWLWPFIPFYLIIGLYIGRDIAIMAHYNMLITLAVIAGLIFLPAYGEGLKDMITAIAAPLYGFYSFFISAVIVVSFYFYARRWAVIESAAEKEAEAQAASPLHYAAETGNLKKFRELLAVGNKLNFDKQTGMTPLHLAAAAGHMQIVELMLMRGVDVNLKTREDKIERLRDCTPLHYAAEQGREKMVEFLLQKGAAVNAGTFHQYTPLHYAALKGNLKITQMLIAGGADIGAVEVGGFTALQLAEKFENKKIADFLRTIRY